jgi:hypothetical protein
MLHPLRVTQGLLLVLLAACGRSALPALLGNDAGGGNGGLLAVAGTPATVSAVCGNGRIETGEQCDRTTFGDATCAALGWNGGLLRCARDCQFDTSGCVAAAPPITMPALPTTGRCPVPDSPVALTRPCIEQLCNCDRAAFSRCDFACWSRVACQVATCNNDPSRKECPAGCPDASADELSLGRCYEAATVCTRR